MMIAVDGDADYPPPLRESGLVLRTITNTLARAGW
jgi:hypothetical protein